jgi:hypothetical protein
MTDKSNTVVEFSKPMALPGAIAGAVIAVGVPAVTMVYGRQLPPAWQMVVILCGLGLGAAIAFVSAFFAAVMPTSVRGAGVATGGRDAIAANAPAEPPTTTGQPDVANPPPGG